MRVSWFTIAAAVVAGGVIHIAAVLSVPYLAREDAWGRLARFSSVNQLYLMPPGAPRLVPLPLAAPDMAYAFCRFDLTDGNVVFESTVPSPLWSAAMHNRRGENFYVITGADIQRDDIRMLVVPRARLAEEASAEISARGEEQVIVISPEMQGIITVRIPNRGSVFTAQTVKALQAARCAAAEEIEDMPVQKQTPPGYPPLPSPRVPAITTLNPGVIN